MYCVLIPVALIGRIQCAEMTHLLNCYYVTKSANCNWAQSLLDSQNWQEKTSISSKNSWPSCKPILIVSRLSTEICSGSQNQINTDTVFVVTCDIVGGKQEHPWSLLIRELGDSNWKLVLLSWFELVSFKKGPQK